jgi:hypothetical protein
LCAVKKVTGCSLYLFPYFSNDGYEENSSI